MANLKAPWLRHTPTAQTAPLLLETLLRRTAHQCWQADVTHWHLAHGGGVEILNIIDDHSRLAIASLARRCIGGTDVTVTFTTAFTTWGPPASALTDNGAIFTGQPRRGGGTALEITLGALGINYLTSRPYHPRTCGKVERFHQTSKEMADRTPRGHDR